ncbi:Prolidase [Intoshia linei]|uniref:Prolidase n=1 Tax=Intoshia linei TaxID=1819745 RepID=A0A177B8Y6_9BILA|nr:Prolidase [Intoshia linei]
MRSAKPGLYEYQCESVFLNDLYYNSSMRHVGYTSIVASGLNAAILHYGHAAAPNDRQMKNGELWFTNKLNSLADCGGEYYGYTADITVTFPVNGKFDLQQVDIYNLVLSVNRKIFNMANVGVKWVDLHIKSLKLIADGLLKLNLLIGDIDEIYASGVAKLFMPHGLGHQLGLDVHDVNPKVKTDGKFEVLRTHCILAENMIVTIEPGCYFIKSLLDSGYKDLKYKKFLNKKVIDEYVHVGGVRIEDDVLITKSGAEDLVKLPRTVKEIESFLKK